MIKAFKIAGLIVGVFLFTSTFNLTSAQQYPANATSQNASIVLQIQTLQAEIADLRDMIERQNYQIRLLKKQLTTTNPSSQVTSSASSASGLNQNTSFSSNSASGLISDQAETLVPNKTEVALGGVAVSAGVGNASSVNSSVNAPVYAGASTTSINSANGVIVEERNLGSRETVYSANDVVPVTEVRVGADNSQQQQELQAQPESSAETQPKNIGVAPAPPVTQQPTAPIVPLPSQSDVTEIAQSAALEQKTTLSQPSNANVINETNNNIQPVETTLPTTLPVTGVPTSEKVSSALPNTSLSPAGAVPSPNSAPDLPKEVVVPESEYYQEGFELLKQSNHSGAVDVFQKQITAYPEGDLADDAYYWIAESMYVNRRLNVSKENFKVIIDGYKSSPRLPDAMLKTAYIEQEQGNKIEARLLLQEIIQQHPSSNAAISAKNRLEQLN